MAPPPGEAPSGLVRRLVRCLVGQPTRSAYPVRSVWSGLSGRVCMVGPSGSGLCSDLPGDLPVTSGGFG